MGQARKGADAHATAGFGQPRASVSELARPLGRSHCPSGIVVASGNPRSTGSVHSASTSRIRDPPSPQKGDSHRGVVRLPLPAPRKDTRGAWQAERHATLFPPAHWTRVAPLPYPSVLIHPAPGPHPGLPRRLPGAVGDRGPPTAASTWRPIGAQAHTTPGSSTLSSRGPDRPNWPSPLALNEWERCARQHTCGDQPWSLM